MLRCSIVILLLQYWYLFLNYGLISYGLSLENCVIMVYSLYSALRKKMPNEYPTAKTWSRHWEEVLAFTNTEKFSFLAGL
jgi:hypothetical protein